VAPIVQGTICLQRCGDEEEGLDDRRRTKPDDGITIRALSIRCDELPTTRLGISTKAGHLNEAHVQTKNGSQPDQSCCNWLAAVYVFKYQNYKLEFEARPDKWRRSRGTLRLIVARTEDIVARSEPIQLICRPSRDIRPRCTILLPRCVQPDKSKTPGHCKLPESTPPLIKEAFGGDVAMENDHVSI
jgi:hypothetical protein